MIQEYLNLLKDFPDRETKLRQITRYSLYTIMFYRTNLWIHSKRVAWITGVIASSAQKIWPEFNLEKAILMALCHDDQEIIMGDIQAGNKAKMTPEQLLEVEKLENEAIEQIAEQFPTKLGNYIYKDLLQEVADLKTPEAWVVKYADKMDAFGEALHEVFAGNIQFETNTVNEYGVIPTATEYYLDYFANFSKKFPETEKWLSANATSPFLQPFTKQPFKEIAQVHKSHTAESILGKSEYRPYELWKELIIDRGGAEELKNLSTQTEYLAQ